MNFITYEVTFLRYFIPLIIEGNKRGIKSIVYVPSEGTIHKKYNHPHIHRDMMKKFASTYNFQIKNINDIGQHSGITFLIEACGIDRVSDKKYKKIVLTYMTDYFYMYSGYIDDCDHVVFPSERFAKEYKTLSEKNLYLGCPKYDIEIPRNLDKDNKKALVIFPHPHVGKPADLARVYNILRQNDYEILVKTRGKHRITHKPFRGDKYFEDTSWFPHTTMQLLRSCDVAINFDSTSIKECVMMGTPILNFNVKEDMGNVNNYSNLKFRKLEFLYNYEFCKNVSPGTVTEDEIKEALLELTNKNYDEVFHEARSENMLVGNSSKRILDALGC